MAHDYDFFVIGAGSGGVRAARIAARHGARVGIAEEHRIGGTCVIRGCVPKKLLAYGAQFAKDMAHAQGFGWTIEQASFSWESLRDTVLADVTRLNGLYRKNLEAANVRIYDARAQFLDPHTLDVGGERVTAAHILIATGAYPAVPDIPGADLGLTSNEVFHIDQLPAHIAIVGGGYIACEFAGIFQALGSRVTMIARGDTILREYDQGLVERLIAIMRAKGTDVRFDTGGLAQVDKSADGLNIQLCHGEALKADMLLHAMGRLPNSANLGLEAIGVATNPQTGAIIVDEKGHTSMPHIHAVGDVTNRVQLTPVAIREGHALADRLFGQEDRLIDYSHIPSAVFSSPPLSGVGLTEDEARARYDDIKVYTSDFRPMKHTLSGDPERAYYKLVTDAEDGRILGAHLLGPDSAEILQILAVCVKAGLTKADLDATVALHPTMAEELVLL